MLWTRRLLAPLGFSLFLFTPQVLAIGAPPSAPGESETAFMSMPLPEDTGALAPLSRPGDTPGGISRKVQCRRICTYRVLKRRGVVISRTPTACRLECPGMATRSCSTGECR